MRLQCIKGNNWPQEAKFIPEKVRPATSDDDPGQQHDWRTYPVDEESFTVPGSLVQPIKPSTSKTHMGLDSSILSPRECCACGINSEPLSKSHNFLP